MVSENVEASCDLIAFGEGNEGLDSVEPAPPSSAHPIIMLCVNEGLMLDGTTPGNVKSG